ncbi:MAG TPA: DUF2177 family protein [Acetobacteraceae bacterium]|nr:DUF2177 family protein [Acetobacteraceae bacterium]
MRIASYLSALVVFVGLDLVWIGWVANGFYRTEMGALLRDPPDWRFAVLLYALYPACIVILTVPPGPQSWLRAMLLGAVLGLCAYGTYNLTNQAVLRGWSVRLVLVDMAWGTALTALAAVAAQLVQNR